MPSTRRSSKQLFPEQMVWSSKAGNKDRPSQSKSNLTGHPERLLRRVAPADCWNWGECGLKEYNIQMKGVLPSLVRSCRYKWFLFCLGCSSRPSTKNIIFLTYTISVLLTPSPNKLSRQPCWVACLLRCVCAGHSSPAMLIRTPSRASSPW